MISVHCGIYTSSVPGDFDILPGDVDDAVEREDFFGDDWVAVRSFGGAVK